MSVGLITTTSFPTVFNLFIYFAPLHPIIFISTLHILPLQIYHSSVLLAISYLLCHHGLFFAFTSLISPHLLTSYIDFFILYYLLYVCFTPCVTLCRCMCQTALLYLGQVLNLPTWLNKGELKKLKYKIQQTHMPAKSVSSASC